MATQSYAPGQQAHETPRASLPLFLAIWALMAALAVVAVAALKPPQPLPATAPANEFSAARALTHVREIARVPHPVGSQADSAVREYLVAQLSGLGVEAHVFPGMGIDPTAHSIIAGYTNDIVGVMRGSQPGPAIMLMAHYDSVAAAPGAGDDASGVATILEMVRALRAGPALQHDLYILFTDGEEAGLLGADAFAHSFPWRGKVALILNFEARGNRGASLLFETSTNNAALIDAVARVAPHPIGSSLFYSLYKELPNDTDFTVFRPAGVPGLNFAFGEGLDAYHSSLDTPDNLSLASLQHHGSWGLSLARHFDKVDLNGLKQARGDDVFFDWFGDRLIAYHQRWVLPGQILITALMIAAFVVAFRRKAVSARGTGLGFLAALAITVGLALTAAGAWWVVSAILGDRRVITDCSANVLLLSGFMLLSACLGMTLLRLFRRTSGVQELSLGALGFWFLLSWLLATGLPAGSYLLFWPLLLGLLGAVFASRAETAAAIRNVPAAAAAVLLFAPTVYLLYIFLTLQMISVVAGAILFALFLLISIPLFGPVLRVPARWGLGALGLAAMVCFVAGVALSGYNSERPNRDSILYSLNADDNSAVWMSYDQKPDAWTRQFLGTNPQPRKPMQDYLAGFPRPLLSAAAPAVPLLPPVIENVEETQEGGRYRLKLRIRSQRGADALSLRFAGGVQPVTAKIEGREVPVRKDSRWGVLVSAMRDQPVTLEFELKDPAVSFWLMDRSNGVPGEVRPRPANLMPSDAGDVTYVCRKYAIGDRSN